MIWTTTPRTAAVFTASRASRTSTKVENAKLTEQQNQALLSLIGHFLQAVVDVSSLFEHGETRIIDVPSLLFVRSVGFSDALGKFVKPIHKSVELLPA